MEGEIAMARLLLRPKKPIPSCRRDEGSTSIAAVELATVTAPKGRPWRVLTIAKKS